MHWRLFIRSSTEVGDMGTWSLESVQEEEQVKKRAVETGATIPPR